MSAVKVSLKTDELEKLLSLYGLAWDRRDKTHAKLSRALEQSKKEDN